MCTWKLLYQKNLGMFILVPSSVVPRENMSKIENFLI
jgi:hypothetical protein